MKFDAEFPNCREGVFVPPNFAEPREIVEVVQFAEGLGYDALWATDFLAPTPEYGMPEDEKPNWYEPDVNQTYTEMAEHYGVAVLPARVRRPRDKAKVESGVLQVERWILARLRNQTFFSLRELNESIRTLLVRERPRAEYPDAAARRQVQRTNVRKMEPGPLFFGEEMGYTDHALEGNVRETRTRRALACRARHDSCDVTRWGDQ